MQTSENDSASSSGPPAGRRIAALIRHGHYEQPEDVPSAHLPHPLTDRGQEQSRALARALYETARVEQWTFHPVIDSSRMLRAWETAHVLRSHLSECGIQPLLVEQFDEMAERSLGAGANLTRAEIERVVARDPRYGPLHDGWKQDSFFRLPLQGAESLMESGRRLADFLRNRMAEIPVAQAPILKLFVGHGGSIRHAAHQLGVLQLEDVSGLSMHHASAVFLEQTAEGWVHIGGEWKTRQSAMD